MLLNQPHEVDIRRTGYTPLILEKNALVPETLPVERWNSQQMMYMQYWNIYLGKKWTEPDSTQQQTNEEPVLKYPLRTNSLKQFVQKHASTMIGEVPDSSDALVRAECTPVAILSDDITEEQKEEAKRTEKFINFVWDENDGRVLQAENAMITQILGGCYFKLNYFYKDPERLSDMRLETVLPDYVLPVWDSTDYYNLLECFIVYRIPESEARLKYGVKIDGLQGIYCEHWTRTHLTITIDGKPANFMVGSNTISYDNHKHNFGFIPIVYFPRFRAGDFYGVSWMQDVEGLLMEWNSRTADLADAIRETVHPATYFRNIAGNMRLRKLPNGRVGVDLGLTPPEGDPPEVKRDDPPELSEGLVNFGEVLWIQMLREAGLSNIVYGEDEGSQRSALTLAFRMWPVTALARLTRFFWTTGLNRLDRYILRIAAQKKIMGITDGQWQRVRIHQSWAPLIPRDREQQVNETILLYQSGIISMENAHDRIGDIKDSDEEQRRVWDDMKKKAEIQSATSQMAGDEDGAPGGANAPEATSIVGDD